MEETKPLKDFYRETGRFTQIDGMQEVALVHSNILDIVFKGENHPRKSS